MDLKRALRWVVGFVVIAVAGGGVGFGMHFVPGGDRWTLAMVAVVFVAVFAWLTKHGWW